jgi:hypothetical protein
MESAKLFITVLERFRVLASLTCPHPWYAKKTQLGKLPACVVNFTSLSSGNCGSEIGRFRRALTVEAHTRQERDFGESLPPGAACLRICFLFCPMGTLFVVP